MNHRVIAMLPEFLYIYNFFIVNALRHCKANIHLAEENGVIIPFVPVLDQATNCITILQTEKADCNRTCISVATA